MPKKILFIVVVFVCGLVVFFYMKAKDQTVRDQVPVASSPVEDSIVIADLSRGEDIPSKNKSKSAVAVNAQMDAGDNERIAAPDSYWERHVVHKNLDTGVTQTVRIQRLKDAKEFLESHLNEKPEDEIAALRPLNFNVEENGFITSGYKSKAGDFEQLVFYSNDEKKEATPSSCIHTPATGTVKFDSGRIVARSDDKGYAVAMIDGKYYLRMTQAHELVGTDRPHLVVHMYEKQGLDWKFIKEFIGFHLERNKEVHCK